MENAHTQDTEVGRNRNLQSLCRLRMVGRQSHPAWWRDRGHHAAVSATGPISKTFFRKTLLGLIDLQHVHTCESRKEAFADDSVLQENVIFHGIRDEHCGRTVRISVSRGRDFSDMQVREVPFQDVVAPDDSDAFIHLIEQDDGQQVMERMSRFGTTLAELGVEVSTGRVVDFRARQFLRKDPEPGTARSFIPATLRRGVDAGRSRVQRNPMPSLRQTRRRTCSFPPDTMFSRSDSAQRGASKNRGRDLRSDTPGGTVGWIREPSQLLPLARTRIAPRLGAKGWRSS